MSRAVSARGVRAAKVAMTLLRELGPEESARAIRDLSVQGTQLQIRVSRARLEAYREAANDAELSVSDWARRLLDAEVARRR